MSTLGVMKKNLERRSLLAALALWAWPQLALPVLATEPLPTFSSLRHPSVADPRGPYRVEIQPLNGPLPVAGEVRYLLRRGQEIRQAAAPLARREDGVWQGQIPGQPAGTEIGYHFALSLPGGREVLHPRRAPDARYSFQVVPVRLLQLEVPLRPRSGEEGEGGGALPVAATVEATGSLRGEVRYRLGYGEFDRAVPLETHHVTGGLYRLGAVLPKGPVGTVVDFYFHLEVGNEVESRARLPGDAPDRFYTFKVVGHRVEALTGGARVAGIASLDDRLYVGLAGGGLLEFDRGGPVRRHTLEEGLPSSHLTSLKVDPAEGLLFAGTVNGAVTMRRAGSPEWAVGPVFFRREEPFWGGLRSHRRVRVLEVSPLDGAAILQLIDPETELEELPPARLAVLAGGRLQPLDLQVEGQPVTAITAAHFDKVDGCLLLGASASATPLDPAPLLLRRCGGRDEVVRLGPLEVRNLRAIPLAITAVYRDVVTGKVILGLGYRVTDGGRPVERYGVFALAGNRLTSLSHRLMDLPSPISSLLAHPPRGWLLVATAGAGLFALEAMDSEVAGEGPRRHEPGDAAVVSISGIPCGEITALAPGSADGVLIGADCGLFRLDGERATSLQRQHLATGAVQPHLLPADARDANFLFRSPDAGLAVVAAGLSQAPRLHRNLAVGPPLPSGSYGDAAFGPEPGEILAVLTGRGLLRVDAQERQNLLTADQGLYRADLWRILRHPTTGLPWLAFQGVGDLPPATAALQPYAGKAGGPQGRFGSPLPVGPWPPGVQWDALIVPERDSLFVAGPAGVHELGVDGASRRLTSRPAIALARDAGTGRIAAVGLAIERWDGTRFHPVTSLVQHPRFPPRRFALRGALDVAMDAGGRWYVLHAGGEVTLRDPAGRILRVLDFEDGVPVTARALLFDGETGILAIGSATEGAVFLAPAKLVAVAAELPAGLDIRALRVSDLPREWQTYPAPGRLKDLGTDWIRSGASPALAVPSAVIPREWNLLLHLTHPDFPKIRLRKPEPFSFNPKMRKGHR